MPSLIIFSPQSARERGGKAKMKFLVVLCLLAVAAADEDKFQDKKTQSFDTTQNTSASTQNPTSLLNSQVFPSTAFPTVFATAEPGLQVSSLGFSGFNGNVSPIQAVNPDFFAAAAPTGVIPTFPVTRTVLPGTAAIVSGLQSAFPVAGNVFSGAPTGVNAAVPSQFPVGILSAVQGIPAAPTAAPTSNGVVQAVPVTNYKFLTPEGYTGLQTQGLQAAQQIGLAAIPAFTSGILPTFGNSVLQGQTIPAGLQQFLNNPTASATGIPNGLTTGNISGPLSNAFRQA